MITGIVSISHLRALSSALYFTFRALTLLGGWQERHAVNVDCWCASGCVVECRICN